MRTKALFGAVLGALLVSLIVYVAMRDSPTGEKQGELAHISRFPPGLAG